MRSFMQTFMEQVKLVKCSNLEAPYKTLISLMAGYILIILMQQDDLID